MTNSKSIENKGLLRYTDTEEFKDMECLVVNQLGDKSELIRELFRDRHPSDPAYGLRSYLENPLLYGIYCNTAPELSERFTITLIPTADDREMGFRADRPPKVGIYQDRSHGIGLVKVLHVDHPALKYNKKMVFECKYLPEFLENKNIVTYSCENNYPNMDPWKVDWSRKNKSIESSGTAMLYHNWNGRYNKESTELYNMNLERLYQLYTKDK
jgi:hypothetical protein